MPVFMWCLVLSYMGIIGFLSYIAIAILLGDAESKKECAISLQNEAYRGAPDLFRDLEVQHSNSRSRYASNDHGTKN